MKQLLPNRTIVLAALGFAVALLAAGSAWAPPRAGRVVDVSRELSIRFDGGSAFDGVGASVAFAGDVNGDRRGDFVAGAGAVDANGRRDSGSAYVVFGRGQGAVVDLASLAGGFRIDGAAAGDELGERAAAAGDVNGDGRADVIVGADDADVLGRPDAGAAYVVFGKASSERIDVASLGTGGFAILGAGTDSDTGDAVAPAGDVNGDGRGDVVVGAPEAGNNGRADSGSAYVVFGTTSNEAVDLASLGSAGFRIDGAAAGDGAGFSVTGGGDVNGDGRADVVIGAQGADNNGRPESGSAYVVFGKAATDTVDLSALGAQGFRIDGAGANDEAGPVALAGDVNRDRRIDILVGAQNADANGRADSGSAYLVFGKASAASVDLATLGAGGVRIDGAAAGDHLGGGADERQGLAGAGDVNRDGRPDLLVGAHDADRNGRRESGSAYVVFGNPALRRVDVAALRRRGFRIDGAAAGDGLGSSVAAGDVSGDRLPDLILGADTASPHGRQAAGSGYIIFGVLPVCEVPRVRGRTLSQARTALRAAGCRAGTTKRAYSARVRKGRVVSQRPRPGVERRNGARVDLVVSRGKRPSSKG